MKDKRKLSSFFGFSKDDGEESESKEEGIKLATELTLTDEKKLESIKKFDDEDLIKKFKSFLLKTSSLENACDEVFTFENLSHRNFVDLLDRKSEMDEDTLKQVSSNEERIHHLEIVAAKIAFSLNLDPKKKKTDQTLPFGGKELQGKKKRLGPRKGWIHIR
jgi:hypothetical protein